MDQLKTILAKFWVAILCAIIAIAAMIASAWPLGGYHTALHDKLEARAKIYNTAESLRTKARQMPMLPGQSAPQPLAVFPSPSIIKSGESLRDQLNGESVGAVKAVVDANRHYPLLPGVLPNPAGIAPLEYRRAYRDKVGPTGSLFTTLLKAGMPPTIDEIKAESDRIWQTKYKSQIYTDSTGKAYNEGPVTQQFDQENARLPQKMREERAHMFKLYAAGDAMPVDAVVSNVQGLPPDPRKIWWTQMALWVEEDVANAIVAANTVDAGGRPTPDVTTAAIKRLVKLDFPGATSQDQTILFTASKGPAAAMPMDPSAAAAAGPVLVADSATPVPINAALSPSGRTSCPMYDVVQFKLELIVAAKDIPWIMDCIAKDKLMSVLNIVSITTEDTAAAEQAGYFYGSGQLVHVTFLCESVYLREWTLPLMPATVQRVLATSLAPTAQ